MCIGSEGLSASRPTNPDSRTVSVRVALRGFVVPIRHKTEGSPQRKPEHPSARREARAS